MRFLYKILARDAWQNALRDGVFTGSAVDHADGFIHLSAAHQARETAARHFAGQQDLVLIAFAEADLENLTWEPSRGGDLFPHVYGPIQTRAAASVHPLPLVKNAHQFPEDFG
jgi:uncharacterized protein (DUF952 family)